MREPGKTLQTEVFLFPAQGAQTEPQTWKAPTLTTWKIEEETLGGGASGSGWSEWPACLDEPI